MKKTIDCFKMVQNGKVIDEFILRTDSNNHAVISNKGGILFDGYYPEATEKWVEIRNDMAMCAMLGIELV